MLATLSTVLSVVLSTVESVTPLDSDVPITPGELSFSFGVQPVRAAAKISVGIIILFFIRSPLMFFVLL